MGGAGNRGRQCCWLLLALLSLRPLPLSAEPTECGKPAVSGRLYGGQAAPEKRWPWQISLLFRGRHVCGGVLIDSYWVLSAAHCFQLSHKPEDYRILLGYHKLSMPSKYSQHRRVHRVIVHQDFNKTHYMANDITMLQMQVPITFSSYILPACLQKPTDQLAKGTSCWATGWGMVTESDFLPAPQQLQQASLGIIDLRTCGNYFQYDITGHQDVLCAADLNTGKAICRGDSGGPLVCELEEVWYVVGLSSWSMECNPPIGPSVFTNLTYFSEWITENQNKSPVPPKNQVPTQGPPPVLIDFEVNSTVSFSNRPGPCMALLSTQSLFWLLGLPLLSEMCF